MNSSGDGPVDWDGMRRWLVESMASMPCAAVLDIGPAHVADDEDTDVDCVQIQALERGTFLIRLSTMMMSTPLLGGLLVPHTALDAWFYDSRFTDCTHGYLMSRSRDRIADIAVVWFRDRCGVPGPSRLGCSYDVPIALPRSAPGMRHPATRGTP